MFRASVLSHQLCRIRRLVSLKEIRVTEMNWKFRILIIQFVRFDFAFAFQFRKVEREKEEKIESNNRICFHFGRKKIFEKSRIKKNRKSNSTRHTLYLIAACAVNRHNDCGRWKWSSWWCVRNYTVPINSQTYNNKHSVEREKIICTFVHHISDRISSKMSAWNRI